MGTPADSRLNSTEHDAIWAERARVHLAVILRRHAYLAERNGTRPMSELLGIVGTPAATAKVKAYLASQPFPHFEAGPDKGTLVKIDEAGTRTVGRFIGKTFQPD